MPDQNRTDDGRESAKPSRVSRRNLIKGGMVAGGVALWSAPMVATARFGRFDRVRTISPLGSAVQNAGPARVSVASSTGAVAQNHTPCTGYPAEQCLTFQCGGPVTICGPGVTVGGRDFRCFCDIDVTGNCFCGNDAPCSLLSSCSSNSDCPTGWACVPSSCCGGNKCVPPCGTFPGLPGGFGGAGTQAQTQRAGADASRLPAEIAKILSGGRMSGLSG